MKKKKISIARRIAATAAFLLLASLGAIYLTGMAYFQTHLKMGTVINGFHCSMKSADEASALLSREADSYALAVKTRNGGVEKITAEEAGFHFVGQGQITGIIQEQDSLLWFLPETKEISLSPENFQIDMEKLEETVSGLECMNDIVKGKTAKIVNSNGTYQVSPGVRGNEIDKKLVLETVGNAVLSWDESVDLEEEGCYIDVKEADEKALQKQCDFLNSIRDTVITYDFGDRKETVTMDVIEHSLLNRKFKLTTKLARKYAEYLAGKYDTVGMERKFLTFDDRAILLSGGDYGWKIDIDKTAKNLISLISACTIDVTEPAYEQEAANRSQNDVGYSYLEISAGTGDVILYINGSPTVQTRAEIGPGLRNGFWKADTEDGGIVFDISSHIGGPAEGNDGNCAAISEQWAYDEILARMDSDWPVIVYGASEW